jgi:adenosine/AMP kinase
MPGMTAWTKHVKETYDAMKKKNPKAKLGDAMKEAKKTYKKK